MVKKQKKEGVNVSYFLEKTVKDSLDRYCEETGLKQTNAVERILKKFFDEYYNNNNSEKEDNN